MDTGNTIRKLRVENGYTQQQIAGFLKISRNAYLAWESNQVELTLGRLTALCAIYKISLKEFFEYELPRSQKRLQHDAGTEYILEKLKQLKDENDKLISMNVKLVRVIKEVSSKGVLYNLKPADF